MKTPDILDSLNHCGTAIETALRTTIHLINDSIFTDQEVEAEDHFVCEPSLDNN